MPSILNATSSGVAPSGATVGDIVNTAGGTYQVTNPGVPGASYNDASGLWSKKLGDDPLTALYAYQLGQTEANTARSEALAQKQMDFQIEANAKDMAFSAAEAQKDRDWQEYMSNTAHQREVQDLIAAGLNPILSVQHQGATTPSGASAAGVTSSGSMGQVDTSGANIFSSLISGMMQKYQADTSYKMNENTLYTNREIARMQTDAGILNTAVSAAATQAAASMNAAAAMYASDNSYDASVYGYDKSFRASMYTNIMNWIINNKTLDNQTKLAYINGFFGLGQSAVGGLARGVGLFLGATPTGKAASALGNAWRYLK